MCVKGLGVYPSFYICIYIYAYYVHICMFWMLTCFATTFVNYLPFFVRTGTGGYLHFNINVDWLYPMCQCYFMTQEIISLQRNIFVCHRKSFCYFLLFSAVLIEICMIWWIIKAIKEIWCEVSCHHIPLLLQYNQS